MATRPDTVVRNLDLESALDEVTARYTSANPASRAQYERAKQSLPGGNTRTGMFYTPFPLAIEKAAGATLIDVDGHTYTDFVGDFSAGLYGHSHPVIREALMAALDDGMAYGSSSPTRSGWRRSSVPASLPSNRCGLPIRAPRPTPWRWSPPARSAART